MAVQPHIVLAGRACGFGQRFSLCYEDLRPDDVDAGDLFCHRMLHLHPWVNLNEIKFLAVHIHQELNGSGAFIIYMGADFLAQSANLSPLCLGQIGGRRALNDFLVAALNRAIALKEMIDLAEFIAQDLHFHMASPLDHPLQIALTIAKGRLGFAPAF